MISANRPSIAARRTEGKRVQGRSARVLEAVLDAALEELGRVGYRALRIEDVAAKSGVNKTTIYRRWPTKMELIGSVLEHAKEPPTVFDTGSLEGDVRASLYEIRERLHDPRHLAIMRAVMAERMDPEVNEVVAQLRERYAVVRRQIFERAIARGELSPTVDPQSLLDLMSAPIVTRIVHQNREADDAFLEFLTTVICAGAKSLR
jgi:AcrR family transcriptional regulator